MSFDKKKIDGENIVQKERVKFEIFWVSKGNENGEIKWILVFVDQVIGS